MSENYSKYNVSRDISVYTLLAANLVSIFLAVTEGWSLVALMLIYWVQSVTIGFTNFLRMISLKEFSTEGLMSNGKPVTADQAGKLSASLFFAFHYGLFHLGYFVFLLGTTSLTEGTANAIDWRFIGFTSLVFIANHLFSFFYGQKRPQSKLNLGLLLFYPYARIIPMHLTIIFGAGLVGLTTQSSTTFLLLFMSLKTLADIFMHKVEHTFYAKQPNVSPVQI